MIVMPVLAMRCFEEAQQAHPTCWACQCGDASTKTACGERQLRLANIFYTFYIEGRLDLKREISEYAQTVLALRGEV